MKPAATFLFAGGGTGGHLFPGIAIAAELQRRDPLAKMVFVGSTRSIEATIVAEQGLEHRMLSVEPLTMLKRNPLRFLFRNWRACRTAMRLLKELSPAAVIGLGGYASAPLVWAASRRRIPVVLIEQNVIPGRTTRWLSRYARQVCVSFPETISQLPRARQVTVTGNPVRAEIAALLDRSSVVSGMTTVEKTTVEETTTESSSNSPRELLILGGSQGADSLNAAVFAAMPKLAAALSDWRIVHQTGPRDVENARNVYLELGLNAVVAPFFHEMSALYRRASLVISRSGATTLAELACAGTAMVLLPYPFAADDHQRANAQAFFDQHAALIVDHVEPPERTADQLGSALRTLLDDTDRRTAMGRAATELAHPRAAAQIADLIATFQG